MAEFDFLQSQVQSQIQTLSQTQIQSLEILSLSTEDLRNTIYKEVEKNPALIITKDKVAEGVSSTSKKKSTDFIKTSSYSESDKFQSALEAYADNRITLQEHLLQQLNASRISDVQKTIGETLINNLDSKGFHILAPISLLDKKDKNQTEQELKKTLTLIQNFDPVGTCVTNVQESLLVQAQSCKQAPLLAIFLLDNHFDFLDPPQPVKIAKKVQTFLQEQKKLFATDKNNVYQNMQVSEQKASEALTFIKTLNPFPAQNFGASQVKYITPDIYIEEIKLEQDEKDTLLTKKNISNANVVHNTTAWHIRSAKDTIPTVCINPLFEKIQKENKKNLTKQNKDTIEESIKQAQSFIKMLSYRDDTILKAMCTIVKIQHRFFEEGPGNLVPLKQKDIATAIGVHETTISRMANSKYIECKWGLFAVKYFFTNVASKNPESPNAQQDQNATSQEKVLHEIQNILQEHKDDAKKLSDQKICDILAQRGINIARRTVAKYRLKLNIEPSYNR